ncbi:hypothetical protein FKM82_003825 [Ascaphus truei]
MVYFISSYFSFISMKIYFILITAKCYEAEQILQCVFLEDLAFNSRHLAVFSNIKSRITMCLPEVQRSLIETLLLMECICLIQYIHTIQGYYTPTYITVKKTQKTV